jgi:hypothetical protein
MALLQLSHFPSNSFLHDHFKIDNPFHNEFRAHKWGVVEEANRSVISSTASAAD